jgi:hypothetical protein
MIAPTREHAPRMLLVIGEDEQGLPIEMIIPEPSVPQLYDTLRDAVHPCRSACGFRADID